MTYCAGNHIYPAKGVHANNVVWKQEDEDPEGEETERSEIELWSDLEWTNGIVRAPRGYKISNRGRLFSPYSKRTTHGFYYKGHRYAGVRGGLLVDLTAASIGQTWFPLNLPQHLEEAYNALSQGVSPLQHAADRGIKEGTTWGYYHKGNARALPPA